MSSSIDNLRETRGDMNESDTQLVDSILNDLKQNKPQQQQPQQPQQEQGMSPEEQKMLYMQQQQELEQQQKMMNEQMKQQMEQSNDNPNIIQQLSPDTIMDNLKVEGKSILIVILLGLLINLDPINDALKSTANSFFVNVETNELTVQSLFLKAIMMGVLFYVIKNLLIH